MLELVAIGPEPDQRWRRPMPDASTVRLGRSPAGGWAVPWDMRISRDHADLIVAGDRLTVRCLESARNPAYYDGEAVKQLSVGVGEEFIIGKTRFVVGEIAFGTGIVQPLAEHSYKREELRSLPFDNAEGRLETLSRLPDAIAAALGDEDFAQRLVGLLLEGVRHATAAAVVYYDWSADRTDAKPLMMRWEGRDHSGRFAPSRRLIVSALEQRETVLHLWAEQAGKPDQEEYTVSGDLDWAFCTPLRESSCQGWCLYVSGKLTSSVKKAEDLAGDIRFAELLAQFTGAIRQVRMLERQQVGLSQFFSPPVVNTLCRDDSEALLLPKVRDITVLFCDLRGFSWRAEQYQHDLLELLNRCSNALGIMTQSILNHEGVIADFQGDAALAFWGWPLSPAEGPLHACRAALAISAEFAKAREQSGHPLEDFQVGIGVAHGSAVAGKIGTADQAKVGVFGPVVNLGSRLEGLTKRLRAPILLDEATADYARQNLPPEVGRLRRLGCVRPCGMKKALTVTELLPPITDNDTDTVSDDDIRQYESAVDSMSDGEFATALEQLDKLPVTDRAKDFLMNWIAQNDYRPPENWEGIIVMEEK